MIFSLLRFKISKLKLYNYWQYILYLKKLFKFFILFFMYTLIDRTKNSILSGQSKKIGVFHSGK